MIKSTKTTQVIFQPDNEATNNKATVKTLPPQAIAYNKIYALFGGDTELSFTEPEHIKDSGMYEMSIRSANYHKIVALSKILKPQIDNLKISFICTQEDNPYCMTLKDALTGNPHLDNIRIATEAHTGSEHVITTFKDETIQYGADSRFVPNGYETTLAEDLVTELFNDDYQMSAYVTAEHSAKLTLAIDGSIQPYWGCLAVDRTK